MRLVCAVSSTISQEIWILMSANKYKVETKVLTIDVANPESRATGCREIERLTQAVDIGVLGGLGCRRFI